MKSFTIIAVEGFPMIKAGDNVASIFIKATQNDGISIETGDVIAFAQKVFSKAEGRTVNLMDVVPSERAKRVGDKIGKNPRLVELVLKETRRIIKVTREVLLVEDNRGIICINAGIDKSNVEGDGNFTLLPQDPDESARSFREEIERRTGKRVGVVICDTYSRPFHRAQVNFAIGLSGIKPFRDYRTKRDLFGQILRVKNVAVADEIAAAAELLMGQATEARPVVIFRGLDQFVEPCGDCTAKELQISTAEDLFSSAL